MKSSYYTGYSDLDNKLLMLYGKQRDIEIEDSELIRRNQLTPHINTQIIIETHNIHTQINILLEIGKERDKEIKRQIKETSLNP